MLILESNTNNISIVNTCYILIHFDFLPKSLKTLPITLTSQLIDIVNTNNEEWMHSWKKAVVVYTKSFRNFIGTKRLYRPPLGLPDNKLSKENSSRDTELLIVLQHCYKPLLI